MTGTSTKYVRRWNLDDIRFDLIDVDSVRNNDFLFLTLASASFVEILAETYSGNLVLHFEGNEPITDWLRGSWQSDEVQHGLALKKYVNTVWPEFDWERGHKSFTEDYQRLCTVEQLEPERALELIARCVVETGTSTFYRAVHDYVSEPILRELLNNIKTDEIAHYAFFRTHFESENATRRHGAWSSLKTTWHRLRDVRGEDAYIAFKHVYNERYPGQTATDEHWLDYSRTVKSLARNYYPFTMAIKMLLKPIPMSDLSKWCMRWVLSGFARVFSIG